jgi:thiol-disulfide isomerase/thioredoxin
MSDIQTGKTGGARRGPLTYALWAVAVVVAAGALYVIVHLSIKLGAPPAASQGAPSGDMATLTTAYAGQPLPSTPILDAAGHTTTLAALKGRPMIVNMWATWCPPCRKEMPSLAKLQAAYGDKVLIVPVSLDKAPSRETARAFIAANAPLGFYEDEALAMPYAVTPPVEGFPTTFLFDASGKEVARIPFDHDWSGPEAHAVVDALLAGKVVSGTKPWKAGASGG